MRIFFLGFLFCFLLVSCGENGKNNEAGSDAESLNNEPLYPYPQYISDQIAYVDTVPLAIELLEYENGQRKDSTIIDRQKFKLLANEFAEPDLNTTALRKYYIEKSFRDLTINNITFSITAQDPYLLVQQADILLNPQTKKVKNIIIRKQKTTGEGEEIQKLLWVHNMNFQISTTLTKKDGTTIDRLIHVIWDKPLQ